MQIDVEATRQHGTEPQVPIYSTTTTTTTTPTIADGRRSAPANASQQISIRR